MSSLDRLLASLASLAEWPLVLMGGVIVLGLTFVIITAVVRRR